MNHLPLNIYLVSAGFMSGLFAAPLKDKPLTHVAPREYYLGTHFTYVKAVDGDTLDIQDSYGNITRIRLHAIDTPERGLPYYEKAAQNLEALCKDTDIRLTQIGDGGYGRISAYVYCGDVNVNTAQIENGMAIISINYANELHLYRLQDKARELCKGIWREVLQNNYPAKRLSGQSPIKGHVKFTNNAACHI